MTPIPDAAPVRNTTDLGADLQAQVIKISLCGFHMTAESIAKVACHMLMGLLMKSAQLLPYCKTWNS